MTTGKHMYHVRAFAPDPRGGDNYFVYNGEVARSEPIDSGEQYDLLLEGLAEHVLAETGVRCSPQSFALQSVQRVDVGLQQTTET